MKGGTHEKNEKKGQKGMCQRNDVEQLRKQQKTGRLFETLTFLEKQMNDEAVIQDADTVLADILEEADFEITGIAADLLKIHQNSKDRESVETCFEVLTGWTIPDYLKKCIATILEQKNKAVSNSKECLLYQGMHLFPVGKKEEKEGEGYLPMKKILNDEKEIDRLQKVQEQTGLDVFLCLENYQLYFIRNREIFVYQPNGRRRMYADKYSMGRDSAK